MADNFRRPIGGVCHSRSGNEHCEYFGVGHHLTSARAKRWTELSAPSLLAIVLPHCPPRQAVTVA
eukprot:838934-Pyramimonas_sp.AAC.1